MKHKRNYAIKQIKKVDRGGDIIKTVFQFAEIIESNKRYRTFIYQDCSIDYYEWLCENAPDVFKVSGFQFASKRTLIKGRTSQNSYYATCDGIFTMGKWLKDDLINRMGIDASKVHHVGGGINLDPGMICDGSRTGNKILFVGRDYVRKGLEITISAFKILRQTMPDVEIYVAGPLKDPHKECNIEGYHFCGECEYEELSHLFNKCDVFCMPSYFEAYGLAFIEALAYGLPCIGRNCYEMPFFIEEGKTGYLLEKNDATDLSVLMWKALTNEQMKENVKNKRQHYLEEYSWDMVAQRMASFLNT